MITTPAELKDIAVRILTKMSEDADEPFQWDIRQVGDETQIVALYPDCDEPFVTDVAGFVERWCQLQLARDFYGEDEAP